MARRIEGILFDLGETLLDFGEVDIDALFREGSLLAYDYLRGRGHRLPPFERYNRREHRAIRWKYFLSRLRMRELDVLELIDRQNRRGGRQLAPEELLHLAGLWYRPLGERARMEEHLPRTLRALRDMGLALGLVSNTFIPGTVLDEHLERLGLLELLPVRVYSCDVVFRKPDRRIFAAALERCGLRARETMFVGDKLREDVRGSARAGMIPVLKDPAGRHDRSRVRPAHRICRIAELPAIVAGYNG